MWLIVYSIFVLNLRFEFNVVIIKDLGFDLFFGYLYNDFLMFEIWV